MKKYSRWIVCLMMACMMFSSTAYALFGSHVENQDAILKDLKSHPEAYIRYGGRSTGFSFYIEKASIDVQKYAPPEYVIAVRKIIHSDNGMIKEYHKERIVDDTVLRFAYDYKTRNMFVEKKDENGNIVWQYLDPSKADDYEYYQNGLQQMLSAGECAFYLAYNMSFYDQPVSYAFRKYLNEL